MVHDHEPGRVSQYEEIPPAEIACQRQARLLRAETGRCQRLGQGTTRPEQEPQIPSQRKAKAGPDGSESQQVPRLALLPNEDGALPDRVTGQYLAWTTRRPDATCWWCQDSIQTRQLLFKNCPQWRSQQKTLWTTVLEETRKLPGPTRGRYSTCIAELLAHERCSQAVLQFFATTDVGWTSGPPVAEDGEDAATEASEWEARDKAERAWERREEEERLGAE